MGPRPWTDVETRTFHVPNYNRVQKCFGNTFSHSSPTFFPLSPLAMFIIFTALHCATENHNFQHWYGGRGRVSSHIAEKLGKKCIFQTFLNTIVWICSHIKTAVYWCCEALTNWWLTYIFISCYMNILMYTSLTFSWELGGGGGCGW